MGRKPTLTSRRASNKPARQEVTVAEKRQHLRNHFAEFKEKKGCWNPKCKAKVDLQFAHFVQRDVDEDPHPSQMITFHTTKQERTTKRLKLEAELAKGGILCRKCHKDFSRCSDKNESEEEGPAWWKKFRKTGNSVWTQYLKEFQKIGEELSDF